MSNKTKIVHVISSLQEGGAENLLVLLLQALGDQNYEHHVLYFHDGPCADRIDSLNIRTYHVTGLFCLYDPFFWMQVVRMIKTINPHVIHSHLWAGHVSGRLASWLMNIPLISTYHTPHRGGDSSLRRTIDRYTMNQAQFSCAVSDDVNRSWSSIARKANKIAWRTIPNGVNVARFATFQKENKIAPVQIDLPRDVFVYGAVGRFIPSKGYGVLIDAFAQVVKEHPHSRLLLIGWGQQEKLLRQQVKNRGLARHVEFIVGKQAVDYYPFMDVFMLPSSREGMSLALLEAMASALPVITVGAHGHHEVVESEKEGLVLPTDSQNNLIVGMLQAQAEKERFKVYGINARLKVEVRFSVDVMKKKYAELYQLSRNSVSK